MPVVDTTLNPALRQQVARLDRIDPALLELLRHEALTVPSDWVAEYGEYQSGGWWTLSLLNNTGIPTDVTIEDCEPVETSSCCRRTPAATPRTMPSAVHARSEFRRCTPADGAQVFSWPPHYGTRKPMSFLMTVTAHSHPFSTIPTVHLRAGTRRWAHQDAKLSYNHAHTVYLQPSLPWLPGLRHSRSFLRAPIEPWKKDAPGTDSGIEYSARWGGRGKIGKILRELGCTDRLPDPEDIADPVA
jgi:hypothetical protein